MLSTLALCVSLTGSSLGELSPLVKPVPGWELFGFEELHRKQLEGERRAIAFAEEHAAWLEKLIKDLPEVFPPEKARRLLAEVEETRKHVEYWKKREKLLTQWAWDRRFNPGPDTDQAALDELKKLRREFDAQQSSRIAPPPREVNP